MEQLGKYTIVPLSSLLYPKGEQVDARQMLQLSISMDNSQAYFMKLAERHGEVTFTFKNESPYVTAFVGKGETAKIGFGDSVAFALKNALGY